LELIKFDYNCYTGRWPFSKSRRAGFDELRRIHEKHGISTGYISSLDSILYNDPMEGDLELAGILDGTGYKMVPSLNPMLPNIERDFRVADESFEYQAVRIYPGIHGYDYDSPELEQLISIAGEKDKAVFIQTSFGDSRMDYLLKQRQTDLEKIPGLVERFPGIKFVLFNLRIFEITKFHGIFAGRDDIYFDMSELKHSMFALEELIAQGLGEKVVFGSFYPMFDFSGAYIHFNGTDQTTLDRILGNNIFERGKE